MRQRGGKGSSGLRTQIGSSDTREALAGVEGMAGEPKWSRRGAAAGRRCSDGDGEVISIPFDSPALMAVCEIGLLILFFIHGPR